MSWVFGNATAALGNDGYLRRATEGAFPFRKKCDYRRLRGAYVRQFPEIAERKLT